MFSVVKNNLLTEFLNLFDLLDEILKESYMDGKFHIFKVVHKYSKIYFFACFFPTMQ